MSTPQTFQNTPQAAETSKAPQEGRDAKGRFTEGNIGGPGNPFAREVARVRQRILARATDEKVDAAIDAMLEKAGKGDVAAFKAVMPYLAGRPAAPVEPDNLDIEEFKHFQNSAGINSAASKIIEFPGPQFSLVALRLKRHKLDEKVGNLLWKEPPPKEQRGPGSAWWRQTEIELFGKEIKPQAEEADASEGPISNVANGLESSQTPIANGSIDGFPGPDRVNRLGEDRLSQATPSKNGKLHPVGR